MTDELNDAEDGIGRRTVLKGASAGMAAGAFGLFSGPASAADSPEIKNFSVDPTLYPKIFLNFNVATTAGESGSLTADDFTIYEDGAEQTIESFAFAKSTLDIAFVFDTTGSMGSQISAMKAGVTDLTTQLSDAGVDARYGLVPFKDELDSPVKDLTANVSEFQTAVNALSASGGGDFPEDDFDSVVYALNNLSWRAGARKVIVDITDAPSHYRGDGTPISDTTLADVANALTAANALFIAISPDDDRSYPNGSKKKLATTVGGEWFNMYAANFSAILDSLTRLLSSLYTLDYSTCTPPGESREIKVGVTDPGAGELSATGTLSIPSDAELPPSCKERMVGIDIHPGSDPNPINLKRRGVTPVAILGSEDYDPTDPDTGVDVNTVRFGDPDEVGFDYGMTIGGTPPVHGGHVEDVNGDGHPDLVLHFATQKTGFDADDTMGKLVGRTRDGFNLVGFDTVRIINV